MILDYEENLRRKSSKHKIMERKFLLELPFFIIKEVIKENKLTAILLLTIIILITLTIIL